MLKGTMFEEVSITVDVWEKCVNGIGVNLPQRELDVSKGCVLELNEWYLKNGKRVKGLVNGLAAILRDDHIRDVKLGNKKMPGHESKINEKEKIKEKEREIKRMHECMEVCSGKKTCV